MVLRDSSALASAHGVTRFVALITAWTLIVIGQILHEPWFDETQAWGLVIDAGSPLDFPHILQAEGHPWLWHLVLALPAQFTTSVVALQVTVVVFAALNAYLILYRFPAPLVLRILILSSYYVAYEYSVLARTYTVSLTLTLLIVAVAFGPRSGGGRRWLIKYKSVASTLRSIAQLAGQSRFIPRVGLQALTLWVLLFLVCQVSASSVLVAMLLAGLMALIPNLRGVIRRVLWFGSAFAIGAFTSWLQVRGSPHVKSPPDTIVAAAYEAAHILSQAFVPIPIASRDAIWWNSNAIMDVGQRLPIPELLPILATLLTLPVAFLCLKQNVAKLIFAGFLIVFLYTFEYQLAWFFLRHVGQLWVAFLGAYALSALIRDSSPLNLGNTPDRLACLPGWMPPLRHLALGYLLVLASVGGAIAYVADARQTFSYQEEAAAAIKTQHNWRDVPILIQYDVAGIGVCVILDRACTMLTEQARTARSLSWDPTIRGSVPTPDEVLTSAGFAYKASGMPPIVIMNEPLLSPHLRLFYRSSPPTSGGPLDAVTVYRFVP